MYHGELEQESNDPFLSMFVVCGGITREEDDRRSPEGNVLCSGMNPLPDRSLPIVVIYVLSSPTPGSKSLGSATDANVNMHRCHKDMLSMG